MASFDGFPRDTLKFLSDLSKNNNRDWFAKNKSRYEASFLAPSLELIEALRKPIEKVAPLLKVEPKKVGGSLMRIYRDSRFSKDQSPYKTNIGIQFRHQAGKDVHAPGAYLHIAPGEIFFGAGVWRPDSPTLKSIRQFIDQNGSEWRRVKNNKRIKDSFQWYDDRLKSVPRGYGKDHPLIDDLRLKSFLISVDLKRTDIESPQLVALLPKLLRSANPLMATLCQAIGQPY